MLVTDFLYVSVSTLCVQAARIRAHLMLQDSKEFDAKLHRLINTGGVG
jgi:hypothetical protein